MFFRLILVLCLLLVACSPPASAPDVVPDSGVISFTPICDVGRNIGMLVYAYHKNAGGDSSTGYGYAIRMTEDEYNEECMEYEQ